VSIIRDGSYSAPREACSADSAAAILRDVIGDADREHFVILGLDSRNRVVASHVAAIGGENQCALSLPACLRAVLLMGCTAFIVGHNHPSGDPFPSNEDRAMTQKMKEGAKAIGLSLLDHIVIGEEKNYYSFHAENLL
jgi:DNA repair protein RadC